MTELNGSVATIRARRVSFEESLRDLPRHFTRDEDLINSHLVAALSSVFPDGEDYFVRSVRHFRDQVTDPVLKRQVAGFIGQESVHGREHRQLNDRLSELGYPTKKFEKATRAALRLRERIFSAESNLAATAALEHFTATLAELVLTNEEVRDSFGHDGVRKLFMWHALEELEHKAVAFDVYRALGASERTRIWTMRAMRIGFVVGMTLQILISLALDPATWQRGKLRASWRRFKASPVLDLDLWRQLCEYDRPGFHPDDRDTSELVATWREQLFGDEGSMTGILAATA